MHLRLFKKYIIWVSLFFVGEIIAQTPVKHLSTGDSLPYFSIPDQDGKLFNSKAQKGKGILIIFFYPKDNANISTKQVLGFKEHFKGLEEEGATIVGINPGSIESHKSFHQNNKLPYLLLSDKDYKAINLFGIKSTMGTLNRETYVLDYTGKIVFHMDSYLEGAKHAEEALKYIKSQD